MKNYLYLLMVSSLLLSCHQDKEDLNTRNTCECINMGVKFGYCVVSSDSPVKPGMWDYPVKPGMEEWKQFQSNEEMVRACQIPEEILSSLSTEDLTEICLRYPLLCDVFAFNFLSNGANKLFNDFNGIREFFKRKDASKELLKHYNCLMQELKYEAKYVLPVRGLEFLLGFYAQKVETLPKEDYKKMLQCLLCSHEKEIVYDDPNFAYPFPVNFYARAHVIIKISPKSIEKIPYKEKNGVFFSSLGVDKETADIINKLSYQLIK